MDSHTDPLILQSNTAQTENQKLKRQLKLLKIQLHTAQKKQEIAEKAARHMNHELRNRLSTVESIVLVLDELAGQIDSEERQKCVKDASRALSLFSAEIRETTTHFLDLDKINHGEMTYSYHALNLTQYLLDLCHEFHKTANKNRDKDNELQVELEINAKKVDHARNPSEDIWVISSRSALNRIFPNFISNAVKFTEQGSIKILVHTLETNDQAYTLRITVQDTGLGMSPEKAQTLFPTNDSPRKNIYYQLHDSKDIDVQGAGLGLQIAHRTITAYLKGQVTAESKPGEGTAIIVKLSFTKPTIEQIEKAQEQTSPTILSAKSPSFRAMTPQMKLKVLVVDDDSISRKFLENIITSLSLSCDSASNGQEAIDKYQKSMNQFPYHLIFMDIQMNNRNGLEVTQFIRNQEGENKVEKKCIIIGSSGSPEKKESALKAGMTAFLAKPYNKSIIEQILIQHLHLAPETSPLNPKTPLCADNTSPTAPTQLLPIFNPVPVSMLFPPPHSPVSAKSPPLNPEIQAKQEEDKNNKFTMITL